MVNFRFDLQLFAAITAVSDTSKEWILDTTWKVNDATNNPAGTTPTAYFKSGVYYVAGGDNANFDGTFSVATFGATAAGTPGVVNMTAGSGLIGIGASAANGVTTTTAGASITTKGGKIVGTTEQDTVTGLALTGTVSFEGVSVTVKDAANAYTLSDATLTASATAGTGVTAFTSGTITTGTSFGATTKTKIMGTQITGASTVTTTDGESFTVTSNRASAIDLTGATSQFNVVGSSSSETFTTATAGKGVTLSAGDGGDTIKIAGATATAELVSIDGGEGNDTILASATAMGVATGSYIGGGDGRDYIDFANDNTGAALAAALTAKEVTVDGGAGNDTIVTGANTTFSTILGGAGDDSIVNIDASNTVTGGDGADIFDLSVVGTNTANISDYDYNTDKLKAAGTSAATAAKNWVENGDLSSDGTNGKIASRAAAGGAATIQSSNGFFAVNLTSSTTNDQVGLAWVGDNAVTIDGSAETKSVVITGKTNSEADLLVGGAKGDTIYAGAGDSVYGGAGADSISMTASTYGVYVGVGTASGKDTVANFANGFDGDKADTIYMVDGSVSDVSVSVGAANTTFTVGKGSLELTGVTANAVDLLVNGAKVYAIKEGQYATVSDSDSEAAFYVGSGTGGGVDYSKYGDALMVDLSQESFQNINSVKGGTGDTSLMGSAGSETLMAGTGGASLYGGAGKDVLVGNTSAKDEIFFTTGAGKDTVNSFTAGTDDTSDVLNFLGAGITGVSRTSGTQFTIKLSNSDSLTVNSASGKADEKIQWVSGGASGVAKIGSVSGANSFTYESDVTAYFGGSKKDTLTVSDSDDHNIWLDGSQGGATYASIDVVNAASATGNLILAGDTASQSISGGRGASSLWGGAGNAADTLSGNNSGTDMFWYGLGEGKDVLQNVGVEDVVNVYNINLANVTGAEIGNSSIAIKTTAGDTLTVNRTSGAATTTFQLADGSKWNANYSSKTWEQA